MQFLSKLRRLFKADNPLRSSLSARGKFVVEHFDKDGNLKGVYEFPNGIVDVGLNNILDVHFHAGTQITAWYIGIINNSGYTAIAASDTMASHAGWTEFTGYTEANRVAWDEGAPAARSITSATQSVFSINATGTLRGIFVTSNNTKSGTTGTLWATALFAATVPVASSDQLKVSYTVSG